MWKFYHPQTEKEIANHKALLVENSIRPMVLQIWTTNADGTNKKQVTDNGVANFGPYFFPNSNRIIFSSNLQDAKKRDFDLYAVNVDGSGLERVTYYNGFDEFPIFSPDGKHLAFASYRNQIKRSDTNLFLAEWNYK